MSKQFLKELPGLIRHGVIDEAAAVRIERFYEKQSTHRTSRLLIIFGILGALLVGLGIILIVAHNWDSFSKTSRLIFAALPLLISQIVATVLVIRGSQSVAFREGTAAFIILSTGAIISLVSQIYNIQGDLGKFLFVWTLLAVPCVYVLESSVASMLAWIGATSFVVTAGFDNGMGISTYWYLLLTALITPHFIKLLRKTPDSNFTLFHHWILPSSLAIALYWLEPDIERFMIFSYVGLFGIFLLVSQIDFFSKLRLLINGWLVIGNLGTIILLIVCSFERRPESYRGSIDKFLIAIVVSYMAGLFYLVREKGFRSLNPTIWCFPIFAIVFFIGTTSPDIFQVLINLMLLGLSIVIILDGARKNHLGILNYGLIMISVLVVCRFFDTQISFVLRGLIFILVGAGFFGFNYWIIRRNKTN